MYYARNTFSFIIEDTAHHCLQPFVNWLEGIGTDQCRSLQSLLIVIGLPNALGLATNVYKNFQESLEEAGCGKDLVCKVAYEDVHSAKPHYLWYGYSNCPPGYMGVATAGPPKSAEETNYLKGHFDGTIDDVAPMMEKFEPIALDELATGSEKAVDRVDSQDSLVSDVVETGWMVTATRARALQVSENLKRSAQDGDGED